MGTITQILYQIVFSTQDRKDTLYKKNRDKHLLDVICNRDLLCLQTTFQKQMENQVDTKLPYGPPARNADKQKVPGLRICNPCSSLSSSTFLDLRTRINDF